MSLGVLSADIFDAVGDSAEFTARATEAYSDPVVSDLLAHDIATQIVSADPELVAVQPILESVTGTLLVSDVATSTFVAAVADLHRTVFTDGNDTLIIRLADLIVVAKAQLSALDPEAGALIPDDLTDAIIDVQTSPAVIDAVQSVNELWAWSVLLSLLGMAALAIAAWLSPSGVAGTARVGVSIAVAGGLVLLLQSVARAFRGHRRSRR